MANTLLHALPIGLPCDSSELKDAVGSSHPNDGGIRIDSQVNGRTRANEIERLSEPLGAK